MKKFITLLLVSLITVTSVFCFTGCNMFIDEQGNRHDEQGVTYAPDIDYETDTVKETFEESYADGYGGIDLPEYVKAFQSGTEITAFENMTDDFQIQQETAIMRSVYYNAEINRNNVFEPLPAYTIAVIKHSGDDVKETKPHTVIFLDADENAISAGVQIKIKVNVYTSINSVQVLPERLGATAEWNSTEIYVTVNQYRPYTLIVNPNSGDTDTYTYPITIFVRKPIKFDLPYGWTLKRFGPGVHLIDYDEIKALFTVNKTIVYLEAGCLLVPRTTGVFADRTFFFGNDKELKHIKVIGHGMIDASKLGFHEVLGAFYFSNITDLEINGVTVLNSCNWTVEIRGCKEVKVEDCIVFGYRTNSDGICITSCSDVEVKNCFARSGDDLFEVKCSSGTPSEDITFNGCVAWADVCRGFGIIQETRDKVNNITFKDCSLLYQLSDWSTNSIKDGRGLNTSGEDCYMAGWTIAAHEKGDVTNVLFENCDIHYCLANAINLSVGINHETEIIGFDNKIDGVTFKNCSFTNCESSNKERSRYLRIYVNSRLLDEDKVPNAISNVKFENLYINGTLQTNADTLKSNNNTKVWCFTSDDSTQLNVDLLFSKFVSVYAS